MNKKNILILITSSYGGGAERLVLNQMKLYKKESFILHVITIRKGNIENKFIREGGKLYHSLNVKKGFSLVALWKIVKYIKRNRINLIHVHLIEAEIYAFIVKIVCPKVKVIVTKHNANDFLKKISWRLIVKILSLMEDKIICVSNEVYKVFSDIISNKDKMVVYYNGIIIKENKKKSWIKTRDKYGFSNGDFIVGIIGRLTKQKGHTLLIEATKVLKEKIPNLRVVIVGDGELREKLQCYIEKNQLKNKIYFLGYHKDIIPIYSMLDIIAVPSLWEGLSLVLLEAMGQGKVVVASDLPNNKEVITDKKDGVLFRKEKFDELADKIYYLYNNPKELDRIGKNAKIRIMNNFDFNKNLKEIEKTYYDFFKILTNNK